MFRWLENFVQRRRFFEGLRAAPDGGWGRRGNLFIFSYILTARRRISKLMMKRVESSFLVLAHAMSRSETLAYGFICFLSRVPGLLVVQGARLVI